MNVIGIINHKGGVGKTFLATHLALGLGDLMNYKVCAVDYDAQGDLMKWGTGGKWNGEDNVMYHNVIFVYSPGDIAFQEDFDFVIVDGRPSYDAFPSFFRECNIIIVPVEGRLSVDGATDILRFENELNSKVPVWIIKNKVWQAKSLSDREKEIVDIMVKTYNIDVFHSDFSNSESVRMAEANLIPIWGLNGHHAKGIKDAMIDILNWISKQFGDGRELRKETMLKKRVI